MMNVFNKMTDAENIRAGDPYDDPAFERLAREHDVWGRAESALCAVFWLAGKAQSPSGQSVGPAGAPDRIFLVIGDGVPANTPFSQLAEVTWCPDRVNDTDIEYVRAQPAAATPDEIEGLRAHVALLKSALAQSERENDELRAQPAAATVPADAILRDALTPFAVITEDDFKGSIFEGRPDDTEVLYFHASGKEITMGDFRRARAALAAPAAPQAAPAVTDQWLGIETAPKDGRTLLLGYRNSHGKWRTVRGKWMSADYIAEHWEDPDDAEPGWFETAVEAEDPPNCWHIKPTHWMSLPGAPAALTTQGASHE